MKHTKKETSEGRADKTRITKIKLDVYERLKRDAKYKKMGVDQYLDSFLRSQIFEPKRKNSKQKKDFLGYCPHCKSAVKHSTLKEERSELDHDPQELLTKQTKSWLSRLLRR